MTSANFKMLSSLVSVLYMLEVVQVCYSATRLSVATQQTFFYKLAIKYKTTSDVFNNSLLRHLPVGLCKEA